MDEKGGAVEPQYMKKSAVGGDPYACLFQRILVLPNRPPPPGFRQFEVDAYWPKDNNNNSCNSSSSARISKKRRTSKSNKKKKINATVTTTNKNALVHEIQSWRKERDDRKEAATAKTKLLTNQANKQPANQNNSKHNSTAIKCISKGDNNMQRPPPPNKKNATIAHRVPSRRVGKTTVRKQFSQQQQHEEEQQEQQLDLVTSDLPSKPLNIIPNSLHVDTVKHTLPHTSVLAPTPTSVPTTQEIALEMALKNLQNEAKAANCTTSSAKTKQSEIHALHGKGSLLSPRVAKPGLYRKTPGLNSKTNVPSSMLPTIKTKVIKASLIISDILIQQQKEKQTSVPPSGAAQATEILHDIAQSVQGAAMIRDTPHLMSGLSQLVDAFVVMVSPKNEVVIPSLMALSSLCRRFAQITERMVAPQQPTTDQTDRNDSPNPLVYALTGVKMLLQLSIRCVVHLHHVVLSKQSSNQAIETGVPRLAATTHLLKGLAEYCCSCTSNLPTEKELQKRHLFITGGGVVALLALSQSHLKTSSRPARVALAHFDTNDLVMLAAPEFQLQNDCQLKTDPLARQITDMASSALQVERDKRNQQQRRGQLGLRKQKDIRNKNNSQQELEQRQQKLAKWLGKRGEQNAVDRDTWKERDREQKALLAMKLESDKIRYAKEKLERSEAAEAYRKDMLVKFQEQKLKKRERAEAIAVAEEITAKKKEAATQAKVEGWLKKKHETMREQREQELNKNRVAHRKNMKHLRKRNNETYGHSDFSDPQERRNINGTTVKRKPVPPSVGTRAPQSHSVVPASGSRLAARSVGGSKLLKRSAGGGRHQKLYGAAKDEFYKAPSASPPNFGITGHKLTH